MCNEVCHNKNVFAVNGKEKHAKFYNIGVKMHTKIKYKNIQKINGILEKFNTQFHAAAYYIYQGMF